MLNAIMEGVFDGTMTMADLRSHGDFGIGTFNALDGELVALDGDFYQLRSDGSARLAGDDMRTPFAVVQHFREEKSQAIAGPEGIAELTDRVHALGGSDNYFYAIRVDGRFSGLTVRAVPRQEKPYPPLIEATRKQSVFNLGPDRRVLGRFSVPGFLARHQYARAAPSLHHVRSEARRPRSRLRSRVGQAHPRSHVGFLSRASRGRGLQFSGPGQGRK